MTFNGCDNFDWSRAAKIAESATSFNVAQIIANATNGKKPDFDSLSRESIHQLKEDGTHGEGRSTSEAKEIYDELPNSFDSNQEVEDFLTNPNFELGHDVPYSQGGSNGAENTMYMPRNLNRSIGDDRPTEDQIQQSKQAVIDESSFGNHELTEKSIDFALSLTGPAATRLTGLLLEFIGHTARNDQEQMKKSLDKIPQELTKGAEDAFTRAAPAIIAEAMLSGAAPLGWALKDLAEGNVQGFIGKAGLGIACTALPPLGWGLAAWYAIQKLSNCDPGLGTYTNCRTKSKFKRDKEAEKRANKELDSIFAQ